MVLSDAFARQTPAIKEFLQSPPTPLTRRPRRPATMTLRRPGDVMSMQLGGHFHAAFVRDIAGANDHPWSTCPTPRISYRALPAAGLEPPAGGEPGFGDGRYTLTDIIQLQRDAAALFAPSHGAATVPSLT